METLSSILLLVLPCLGFFVVGIGLWALGQWLRRRGHGDRLDQIGEKVSKGQRMTGRALAPVSGSFVSLARSMSRIPLLGNKRSREMWQDLEEMERQRRNPRN
ncbi:hypothetical protein [Pseudomonas oryzihabitans]|uniref:hypothetical protein n=1 Tax=Pseudomonas oryzihabitans TaxID=47885 RepID=UPI0009E4BCF9|nr:hypothetical protein [Pseudomonas oryzihabitans]